MSQFVKSQWVTDGNEMRLSMPLAKVDEENRLVSGFATLDNVDSQGDIVLAEASAQAFARARGNLREMHQPIAVGKVVDFREEEYYDSEDQKFYRGIYVTAYVSTGASSTWEKVLDGTLTGFSIGGAIKDASNEFVKDANGGEGAVIRFIKDYDLVELSLVDNPANQLANVFSITKAANGSVTVKGMAVETEIENVFYCAKDEQFQVTDSDSAKCIVCASAMENIGWFEAGGNRAEKVRDVVTKFLGRDDAVENAEGEGGVTMPEEVTKSEETPAEEVVVPEESAADVEAEQIEEQEPVVEETANVDENVPDEQEEISKKIDELHEAVKKNLEETRTETTEKVAALESKIAEVAKSFETKASELETKFNEFGDKLEAAKSRLTEFEKALEAVNSSEAVRKSGDHESTENVQKSASIWNGAFSVDNLLK